MIRTILSFNSLYATGERSIPASFPAPILKLCAFGTNYLIQLLDSPTKTAVVRAIHLCPLAPKAALVKAFNASYLSQSGIIIA